MARVRLFGKKRGTRDTGRGRQASAWLVVFFSIFLLAGCGVAFFLIQQLFVPEWRVNHDFVPGRCLVLDKRIQRTEGEDGPVFRPEIHIQYTVNDVVHTKWAYDIGRISSGDRQKSEQAIARFQTNQTYPCWYDPRDPEQVVLVRGYSWAIWFIAAVPGAFIAIGGFGLAYQIVHWGKSAERRSATAKTVLWDDPREQLDVEDELPCVPADVNLTNSPGTTLRYRLPSASPIWGVWATLLFCVFWNGIVSIFVVMVVRNHLQGRPEWLLTLFLIPFVLVGIGLLVALVHQVLVATGIGPTLMEISDHPLRPDGHYDLFVTQSGRLTMNRFRVSLVCEEEATYQQGTDTRTDTHRVYDQLLLEKEDFEINHSRPLEARFNVGVPAQAMHSFASDHNKITWKLIVEGDVARWPNYSRAFPVIVNPPVAARTSQ